MSYQDWLMENDRQMQRSRIAGSIAGRDERMFAGNPAALAAMRYQREHDPTPTDPYQGGWRQSEGAMNALNRRYPAYSALWNAETDPDYRDRRQTQAGRNWTDQQTAPLRSTVQRLSQQAGAMAPPAPQATPPATPVGGGNPGGQRPVAGIPRMPNAGNALGAAYRSSNPMANLKFGAAGQGGGNMSSGAAPRPVIQGTVPGGASSGTLGKAPAATTGAQQAKPKGTTTGGAMNGMAGASASQTAQAAQQQPSLGQSGFYNPAGASFQHLQFPRQQSKGTYMPPKSAARERRREFSPEEKELLEQGESQWFPKMFPSYATPAHELMSSPGKGALLSGGLGAALGGGLGALALNGAPSRAQGIGAGVGAAGLGGIMGLASYLTRRQGNENVEELIRRSGPDANRYDLLKDQVYSADLDRTNRLQQAGMLAGALDGLGRHHKYASHDKRAIMIPSWGGYRGSAQSPYGVGLEGGYSHALGLIPTPYAGVRLGGQNMGFTFGAQPLGVHVGIDTGRDVGLSHGPRIPRSIWKYMWDKHKGNPDPGTLEWAKQQNPELFKDLDVIADKPEKHKKREKKSALESAALLHLASGALPGLK